MQITADTPLRKATIADFEVNFPAPFAAGHVITAGEAAALNQTLRENINNQLRKKVVAAKEQAAKDGQPFGVEQVQALVDAQVAAYEFGVRAEGSGREPTDPVKKEAMSLITEAVKARLTQGGVKASAAEIKEKALAIYDQATEKWRKAAQSEIDRRAKALAGLDIQL